MPTVMLFVRSKRGLSHTREEDTDEADLALALIALERLVRGGSSGAAERYCSGPAIVPMYGTGAVTLMLSARSDTRRAGGHEVCANV